MDFIAVTTPLLVGDMLKPSQKRMGTYSMTRAQFDALPVDRTTGTTSSGLSGRRITALPSKTGNVIGSSWTGSLRSSADEAFRSG